MDTSPFDFDVVTGPPAPRPDKPRPEETGEPPIPAAPPDGGPNAPS